MLGGNVSSHKFCNCLWCKERFHCETAFALNDGLTKTHCRFCEDLED